MAKFNNITRPDYSDASSLTPVIDFPEYGSGAKEISEALCRVTYSYEETKHTLYDSLKIFYPMKASDLRSLCADIEKRIAERFIGPLFKVGSEADYIEVQERYGKLREFVISLESLEAEDAYTEDHSEEQPEEPEDTYTEE